MLSEAQRPQRSSDREGLLQPHWVYGSFLRLRYSGGAAPQNLATVSARLIVPQQDGSGPTLISEDLLELETTTQAFSIVRYLAPLLVMAKAIAEVDGSLVRDEVRFIREFLVNEFAPSAAELEELRLLLKNVSQLGPLDAASMLLYRLPSSSLDVIASVFRSLAQADGDVNQREAQLMRELLSQLGMQESDLDTFQNSLGLVDNKNIDACLALLGLSGRPSKEELRRAWQRAMKDFHSDRYHGTELPEAIKTMIAKQGAEINAAHDTLKKAFGYGPEQ
jgi:DnaJ like chaperone protein